jgi:integrase
MKTTLTEKKIGKLPAVDADIWDRKQPGLVLRTRQSGAHSWRVHLGRGRWLTIGKLTDLTCDGAREVAQGKLGDQAHGIDLLAEKRRGAGMTFTTFVDERYKPWAVAHLKHGQAAVDRILAHFKDLFGNKPLAEIIAFSVERWRSSRLKGDDAVKATTVNRDLAQLKACLSKAVEWGLLAEHPLRRVKLAKTDRGATVRFLDVAEERRLRAALVARDERRRAERDHANAWRRERQYQEFPTFGTYTDHLTPIVLLAMNTGLRRGELLGLRWADIDLARATLTVRGEGAKSGRTRHIPLNREAVDVLKTWGVKTGGLVFPGGEGKPMESLKTAWLAVVGKKAANLTKFRFHDLRHHFASRLVQAGVDLNTVRELLGHSDFSLTLRYAHLAAENKAAAVAKIGLR